MRQKQKNREKEQHWKRNAVYLRSAVKSTAWSALGKTASMVYLDEEIEFEREKRRTVFLAMLYIFRERTIRRYERMYAKKSRKI